MNSLNRSRVLEKIREEVNLILDEKIPELSKELREKIFANISSLLKSSKGKISGIYVPISTIKNEVYGSIRIFWIIRSEENLEVGVNVLKFFISKTPRTDLEISYISPLSRNMVLDLLLSKKLSQKYKRGDYTGTLDLGSRELLRFFTYCGASKEQAELILSRSKIKESLPNHFIFFITLFDDLKKPEDPSNIVNEYEGFLFFLCRLNGKPLILKSMSKRSYIFSKDNDDDPLLKSYLRLGREKFRSELKRIISASIITNKWKVVNISKFIRDLSFPDKAGT